MRNIGVEFVCIAAIPFVERLRGDKDCGGFTLVFALWPVFPLRQARAIKLRLERCEAATGQLVFDVQRKPASICDPQNPSAFPNRQNIYMFAVSLTRR